MSKKEYFFTKEEEEEIIAAIERAEKETSGEIRVHVENTFEGENIMEQAKIVFNNLKMFNTRERNGVLFFLVVEKKQFAILGDKGIDAIVPNDFWEVTKNKVISQFKKGNFTKGLIEGIEEAGLQLKAYFKYLEDDTNELSNQISKN